MLTFCWVGKSLFMQKIIPRRKNLVTGKYYSCTPEPWPGGSHPRYFSPRPLLRARLPVVSNCWLTLWHEWAPLGNLRWGSQTLSNLCSRHDVDSGCRWRIVSEFVGCRYIYIFLKLPFGCQPDKCHCSGSEPSCASCFTSTSTKLSEHALSSFILWDSERCWMLQGP